MSSKLRRHFLVGAVAIGTVMVLTRYYWVIPPPHLPPKAPQRSAGDTTLLRNNAISSSASNVTQINTPDNLDNINAEKPGYQSQLHESIQRLLGDEENPNWCTYAEAKDTLEEGCVPLLRNMLQDETYRNRWAQISHMIAWLSTSDDIESYNIILAYIRRADLWNEASTRNAEEHLFAKAKALGYLGLFKSDISETLLRDAFTPQGAERLIAEWVHLPHEIPYYSPSQFIAIIQGYASRGLVLSQAPENVVLVREAFDREFQQFKSFDYRVKNHTHGTDVKIFTYYLIADSLAQDDMIKEIGLEEYLRLYDTHEWSARIGPYLEAY